MDISTKDLQTPAGTRRSSAVTLARPSILLEAGVSSGARDLVPLRLCSHLAWYRCTQVGQRVIHTTWRISATRRRLGLVFCLDRQVLLWRRHSLPRHTTQATQATESIRTGLHRKLTRHIKARMTFRPQGARDTRTEDNRNLRHSTWAVYTRDR